MRKSFLIILLIFLFPIWPVYAQTGVNALIGNEDIKHWDGITSTFTRRTSTGGSLTMTPVGNEVDVAVVYKTLGKNETAINAAVTAIPSGAHARIILGVGSWTIGSSQDWSAYSNIVWDVAEGALINYGGYNLKFGGTFKASGKCFSGTGTLTFSIFEAGLYQVFSGLGYSVAIGSAKEVYPKWWGAVGDGLTDDSTAINAAIQASPLGGVIVFSPGSVHIIGTSTNVNKKVKLVGSIPAETTGVTSGVVLKGKSTLSGAVVIMNAANAILEGITVDSQTRSAADGISVLAVDTVLRRVTVINQPRDGIRIGSDSGGASGNTFRLDSVVCRSNTRHGIYIKDFANNANAGTLTNIDCSLNGGDGLYIQGWNNNVNGLLAEGNTAGGLHLGTNAYFNTIIGGDLNEGNGTNLLMDAATYPNYLFGVPYGSGITNNNANTVIINSQKGTWTPVLTFNSSSTGITYQASQGQVGEWTRIGNKVYGTGLIQLSSKGSSNGFAQITGLAPIFTPAGYPDGNIAISYIANMTGLTGAVHGMVLQGAGTINLYQSSATGQAALTDAVFTNTSIIEFSFMYTTAN